MLKLNIRINNRENPLPTENLSLGFSFYLDGDSRNTQVVSYSVTVSENSDFSKIVYDSGDIISSLTQNIPYNGEPLEYAKKYFVKIVAVTDSAETVSETATFETPLYAFDAPWICAEKDKRNSEPLVRYVFDLDKKPILSARLYATALGLYEAQINGKRVGQDYLSPGYTDYIKEVQYDTYDVTDYVKGGKNAVAFLLGKGWFCGHVMQHNEAFGKNIICAAKLTVTYADGKTAEIMTSADWKCAPKSPFISTDINNGETFDARLNADFSSVDYDDSDWENCVLATDEGNFLKFGKLSEVQIIPAKADGVRIYAKLKPVETVFNPKTGIYIFDLGQNFAGTARYALRGKSGQKITFRYGEMLDKDASGAPILYIANLRSAKATDVYIKATDDEEIYEPKFTFHGYRYIEVSGTADITAEDVSGLPFATHMERTGYIETSNAKVNRLYQNVIWGQLSNYISIPTDCPQRDERAGWTGDAEVFIPTGTFNFDTAAFFNKYLTDMNTSLWRSSKRAFPDYIPYIDGFCGKPDAGYSSPAWGDAGTIIPDALYSVYGDKRIIAKMLNGMIDWVEAMRSCTYDNILCSLHSYGDWLSVEGSPKVVTDTLFYARSAYLLSKLAAIIGKKDVSKKYAELFSQIKDSFNKKFVDKAYHVLGDTQTIYALSLDFGLIDSENGRKIIAKRLAADVRKRGNLLSCGFIGVAKLCPVLSEYGYGDVAYDLLLQEKYPSWLYSVNNGATTIWERWNSYTVEHGFGDVGMNSYNHYSLGSIGEWMYRYMLGINSADGYKNIIFKPSLDARLGSAKGSYRSPYGTISVEWQIVTDHLGYKIKLPANTRGRVLLPLKGDVTVNGTPIKISEKLKVIFSDDTGISVEVGSGEYLFEGTFIPTETPYSIAEFCDVTQKQRAAMLRKSERIHGFGEFVYAIKYLFKKYER